jgi:uncharacterized protein with PIN domain
VEDNPLNTERFILDVHLGKLAYHLRMLGFDTAYRNDYRDFDILNIAAGERRTILSKNRSLLATSTLRHCYLVLQTDPRLQLIEVLRRFDLFDSVVPFTRCLLCNTVLQFVKKEAVVQRLPDKVRALFDDFQLCPSCDRIYWRGSHYEKMHAFVEKVLAESHHREGETT